MYADPEVRHYFPDGIRSAEETLNELTWFLNGDPRDARLGLWAAIRSDDGAFVGRCGLLRWEIDGETEIEIAYMIDKACWRKGLGAEAARGLVHHGFSATDAPRLIALIDPEHEASRRTAMAAGLRFWKRVRMDGLATDVFRIDRQTI